MGRVINLKFILTIPLQCKANKKIGTHNQGEIDLVEKNVNLVPMVSLEAGRENLGMRLDFSSEKITLIIFWPIDEVFINLVIFF